jgi:release factor glutamine methyltransferase
MSNIAHWLKKASNLLKGVSATPSLDAELLLSAVITQNRTFLYTHPETLINETDLIQVNTFIEKRLQGMPIAYILGQKEFWTLSLKVNQDTLIPRAETEILVEQALTFLKKHDNPIIFDLGTGSGAIALAIAQTRPDAQVIASDICLNTLDIAKENAEKHNINNVTFFHSNWFDSLPKLKPILIISNPPYIEKNSPLLDEQVIKFEPYKALISQDHGLFDLKYLIRASRDWLQKNGMLLIEFGLNQSIPVQRELEQYNYNEIKLYTDLQNIIRAASATC